MYKVFIYVFNVSSFHSGKGVEVFVMHAQALLDRRALATGN